MNELNPALFPLLDGTCQGSLRSLLFLAFSKELLAGARGVSGHEKSTAGILQYFISSGHTIN